MTTKTETQATATATSTYGTVREVAITDKGLVFVGSVLLGDVDGMERVGWEFAR